MVGTIVGVAIQVGAIILATVFSKKPKIKEKIEAAEKVVMQVVEAVEQIGKMQDLHGEEKKKMAINLAKKILAEYNLEVSDTWLNLAIEAAVFFLNMTTKEHSDS